MVRSEDLKYRCVVNDGFQKTNLHLERKQYNEKITITTTTVFLGARGEGENSSNN